MFCSIIQMYPRNIFNFFFYYNNKFYSNCDWICSSVALGVIKSNLRIQTVVFTPIWNSVRLNTLARCILFPTIWDFLTIEAFISRALNTRSNLRHCLFRESSNFVSTFLTLNRNNVSSTNCAVSNIFFSPFIYPSVLSLSQVFDHFINTVREWVPTQLYTFRRI